MRFHRFAIGLTCALLAMTMAHTDASAGGVYKIIGPDGKISFSDKPPADAATSDKIDVIRTQTVPLSSQPSNNAGAAAKPAAVTPSINNQATAKDPNPAVEKAIIGVLGYEDLVKQTETLCARTLPTSSQKYSGAAEGWRSRNGALVNQAHQTLADKFTEPQRQLIESGIRAKNNAALQSVTAASTASKISWCDNSSDAIKEGTMDVFNKANLSAPLLKTKS